MKRWILVAAVAVALLARRRVTKAPQRRRPTCIRSSGCFRQPRRARWRHDRLLAR